MKPTHPPQHPRTRLAGLALAALAFATVSHAQTYDWLGASGNGNTKSSWNLNAAPDDWVGTVGGSNLTLRTSSNDAIPRSFNLSSNLSANRFLTIGTSNAVITGAPGATLRLFGSRGTGGEEGTSGSGDAGQDIFFTPTNFGGITMDANLSIETQGRISASGGNIVINGNLIRNFGGTLSFVAASNRAVQVNGNITAGSANPNLRFVGAGSTILAGNNDLGSGSLTLLGTTNHTLVLASNNALGGATNQNFGLGDGTAANGRVLTEGAVSIGRNFRVRESTDFTMGGQSAHVSAFTGTITIAANALSASGLTLTAADGGRVNFTGQLDLAAGALNPNLSSITVNAHANGVVNLGHAAGNTYEGGTIVESGTLLVNNTTGSGTGTGTVTVQSGANLGGSGIIAGATTIQAGGFLAPGNSPGLLTFNDDLSLAGTVSFEINGTDRGVSYDGINVGGDLTLGGALVLDFGATAATGTYDLFAVTGSTSGSFSSVALTNAHSSSLSLDSNVWSGTADGLTFSFNQLTGDLTVIPEPSAFAALTGLGVLGLAALRRRRR